MSETTVFPPSLKIERVAIALAIVAGLAHRLVFGWFASLWLDEAFTGTIASQATIAGLITWCRHELSGPFFYGGMWIWEKLAGNSDFALRLPSLIWSLGAVAVMAVWGGPNRRERFIWAGLTALWLPGLMFAAQARPQALLFLLATVQAIAFLRCVNALSPRWLTIWSAVGVLMMLTHIYAAVIVGLQLLCLVWALRGRWRTFWPTLMIFAVVAVWLPLQLSVMVGYLKPGVAWSSRLRPGYLLHLPLDLLGENLASFVILAVVLAILGGQFARRRSAGEPLPYSRGEAMLALSAVAAIVVAVGIGFVRPSFTPRYLIPYMPGLLFGLTCVLCRARLLSGLLPSLVLAAWFGTVVQDTRAYASVDAQRNLYPLEFERGSTWLMARHARRVMFVWDNPTSALSGDALQSEVASFFFRRAGYAADVRAVNVDHRHQSAAELAALADRMGAAILWTGGAIPPAGLHDIAHFDCRDFGGGISSSIACARR